MSKSAQGESSKLAKGYGVYHLLLIFLLLASTAKAETKVRVLLNPGAVPTNQKSGKKFFEITLNQARAEAPGAFLPQIATYNMEDYLVGVLAAEVPQTWPLEMLKAQAVAARSYTLFRVKAQKLKAFDLRADTLDQVFSPKAFTEALRGSAEYKKYVEAVRSTQGMVLKEQGQIIKAYYHSDCGGATDSASLIWGGMGPLRPVSQDSYCRYSQKRNHWTYKLKFSELSKATDIQITKRAESGRVLQVRLTSSGLVQHLSGEELRQWMGYHKLKSTAFTIQKTDSEWIFLGHGFGHGAGLCQFGARSMARNGKSFAEILAHYYPSAQIYVQNKGSAF